MNDWYLKKKFSTVHVMINRLLGELLQMTNSDDSPELKEASNLLMQAGKYLNTAEKALFYKD